MDIKGSMIGSEEMRAVMRNWATGVTVVSTTFDGESHGMTVSSFTSVSLDPAMVLVSLQMEARTHKMVDASGVFGVTILDRSQQEISDRFAGRIPDYEDRFEGLDTNTMITGSPFLPGGLAQFDCRVFDKYEIGGHTLFFGQVLAAQINKVAKPLIYYNRSYWELISNDKY